MQKQQHDKQPPRRGRPITGSPKKNARGNWVIRIPIPGTDKTEPNELPPTITTKERASEVARHWHARYLADPSLAEERKPADMMSNAEYLDAWTDERKGRIKTAEKARGDLMRYVFSDATLRNKRCAFTTPDDLRAVVARLDTLVELKKLKWRTASKIWKRCRVMFHESFSHRLNSLRIRQDDPTNGVKPPRGGVDTAKTILYPDEVTTLLACELLPVEARRLWALMIYLGLRVSELAALDWSAVDMKGRRVVVHRSIDQDADEDADDDTKETKTGDSREIDLFDPIFPLFVALHEETGGVGRVCQFAYATPVERLQSQLRKAGLTRAALLTSSETQQRLRAQDLRATCATWLGLCEQLDDGGRSIVGTRVSRSYASDHLGHRDRTTTEKYYLRGKGIRIHHVGMPFPPLPATLLGPSEPGIPVKLTCQNNGGEMQPSETASQSARRGSTRRTLGRAPKVANEHENSQIDDPASDRIEPVRPREQVKPTEYRTGVEQEIGAFEMALADALQRAAVDRRYDVVSQLARELEARRTARQSPAIVDLAARRRPGR